MTTGDNCVFRILQIHQPSFGHGINPRLISQQQVRYSPHAHGNNEVWLNEEEPHNDNSS